MKKKLFPVVIALLLAVSAAANECRHLVITSDPNYPPFSWQDTENPQKISGAAIELAEMVFKDMGITVESQYKGPWARTLFSAKSGDVDMVAGLYLNEKRQKTLNYVLEAGIADPVVLFVMKDRTLKFEKWEDLIGLKGGVRIGDSFGEAFDKFSKEKLTLEPVGHFNQLFRKIEHNRNEYFLFGLYSGIAYAEQLNVRDMLEYLPKPVVEETLYMAFSRKSQCSGHKEAFSKILEKYINDGVVEMLMEKYLQIWKNQQYQ